MPEAEARLSTSVLTLFGTYPFLQTVFADVGYQGRQFHNARPTAAGSDGGVAGTARAGGEPVSITVYPDAYHDFDHPNLPLHAIDGLAFTAHSDGHAHTGTNPAARQDALSRVPAFLPQ